MCLLSLPNETPLQWEVGNLASVWAQWVSPVRHHSREKLDNLIWYALSESCQRDPTLGNNLPGYMLDESPPMRHHSWQKSDNLPRYMLNGHFWQKSDNLLGCVLSESPQWDTTLRRGWATCLGTGSVNLPSKTPPREIRQLAWVCAQWVSDETTLREVRQLAQKCAQWAPQWSTTLRRGWTTCLGTGSVNLCNKTPPREMRQLA